MSSRYRGTLYVGVTSDLLTRVFQHKNDTASEFVSKYNCKMLVYYCSFEDMPTAIAMEKKLKKGQRNRKIKLIEALNSEWKDLYNELFHNSP